MVIEALWFAQWTDGSVCDNDNIYVDQALSQL